MRAIEVNNITTHYGMGLVLNDVSLYIDDGELVALIGPNGAGKTTLLKTIAGLVVPNSGNIKFRDKEIQGKHPHDIAKLGIAYIPEDRSIFNTMTVKENLELGAYLKRKERKQLLSQVLDRLPELRELLDRRASSLSGGERQMLNMGMGFMSEPSVCLLDEPSLGLSPMITDTLFQTITEINKGGVTILLVEQDANLALHVASRAYVIETGKVAMEGKSSELFVDQRVRKSYLGLQ
jgi:branched-chain amino acid transport system ATP-binding protein